MTKEYTPKNIIIIDGEIHFKRWTVLGVNAEVVKVVKKYSKKHNVTTGRALREIVLKAKNA